MTTITTTVLEFLKSWGAEIAVFFVGVALLVFLDASLVHSISLVHGNGAAIVHGNPATQQTIGE